MVLLRCCVNIAIGSRMPLLGPFVANIHSSIHSFFHSMYLKLQYNNDTEIRVSKRKIARFSLIFRRYEELGQQTNRIKISINSVNDSKQMSKFMIFSNGQNEYKKKQ